MTALSNPTRVAGTTLSGASAACGRLAVIALAAGVIVLCLGSCSSSEKQTSVIEFQGEEFRFELTQFNSSNEARDDEYCLTVVLPVVGEDRQCVKWEGENPVILFTPDNAYVEQTEYLVVPFAAGLAPAEVSQVAFHYFNGVIDAKVLEPSERSPQSPVVWLIVDEFSTLSKSPRMERSTFSDAWVE